MLVKQVSLVNHKNSVILYDQSILCVSTLCLLEHHHSFTHASCIRLKHSYRNIVPTIPSYIPEICKISGVLLVLLCFQVTPHGFDGTHAQILGWCNGWSIRSDSGRSAFQTPAKSYQRLLNDACYCFAWLQHLKDKCTNNPHAVACKSIHTPPPPPKFSHFDTTWAF